MPESRAIESEIARPVEQFEVEAVQADGLVLVRLQVGGKSVRATLGPAFASLVAKQLRQAATDVHIAKLKH